MSSIFYAGITRARAFLNPYKLSTYSRVRARTYSHTLTPCCYRQGHRVTHTVSGRKAGIFSVAYTSPVKGLTHSQEANDQVPGAGLLGCEVV